MENKRIEDKIDKLDGRLDVMDKHLAVYNEQLTHHIKRTEILESQMVPIQSHVTLMNNLAKITVALFGAVASCLGIYAAIKAIFRV